MTPYERIYAAYRAHRPAVDFSALVGRYLQGGLVFSTPDFFVMGMAAKRYEDTLLPQVDWILPCDYDTWHFAAFAGDMRQVWSIMPYPLTWIAFSRIGRSTAELTFVRMDRMKRLCPPHDSLIPCEALAESGL